MWLALLGITQGAAVWTDLLAVLVGPSWIASGLQVAIWAASCVALVEFGQRRFEPHRAWLLRRGAYVLLGAVALLSVACGKFAWLAYEYRVVLAWQGGVMGVILLSQLFAKPENELPQHKLTNALNIAVVALLVCLGATCFQITPLSTLAALVAVACAWLSHRQKHVQGGRMGWLREGLAPAAFLLIAAAGWLVLGRSQDTYAEYVLIGSMETGDNATPGTGLDSPDSLDSDERAGSQAFQIVEVLAASPKLRSCGLAVIPIAAFVLIIFGLSRLPAAR